MLKSLFGNQNLERILLFLFVNETCYGAQIQSLLRVPLTPLQKALARLESAGVIESHYEGKTRIYRLNKTYPLCSELESLLQKAYTLLSPQEKKRYCFIHRPRISLDGERKRDKDAREMLVAFWERLSKVKALSCEVRAKQNEEKFGRADVLVVTENKTIVFQEKGTWLNSQTAFTNSFRWTLDLEQNLITLEHLRYGLSHPTFLFHLTPTGPFVLESVDSHLCGADTYMGNISWDLKAIQFHWRIIGPRKNDELIYRYE